MPRFQSNDLSEQGKMNQSGDNQIKELTHQICQQRNIIAKLEASILQLEDKNYKLDKLVAQIQKQNKKLET